MRIGVGPRVLLLCLLAIFLPACERQPTDVVDTYRSFYQAATQGDWEGLTALMSPRTMAHFRGLGGRLARLSHYQGEVLDLVFYRDIKLHQPLREVSVLSRQEGKVILKVRAGPCGEKGPCLEKQVIMVRQAERWWVEPEVLGGMGSTNPKEK